jgi:hypothetical protein
MSDGYLFRPTGTDRTVDEYAEFFFVRDQYDPEFDGSWDEKTRRAIKLKMLALRASLWAQDGRRAGPVWERHRTAVMKIWPKELPGTRPFCWWRFDSPLRRLPESNPMRPGLVRLDADWELQAAYLNRHGLLSALERATLPPAAYSPTPPQVIQ